MTCVIMSKYNTMASAKTPVIYFTIIFPKTFCQDNFEGN